MLSTGAATGSGRAAGPAPAGSLSPGFLPGDGGISVPRLADADTELTVHPRPERVPQPLPGLLVGQGVAAGRVLGAGAPSVRYRRRQVEELRCRRLPAENPGITSPRAPAPPRGPIRSRRRCSAS